MNIYITRINGLSLGDVTQYTQKMTAQIAHQLGIKEMGIYRYNADAESVESLNARMDGIIAGINRGDLIICQFPTGNGLKFEWSLISHLKAYGGRVAIFLHDLEPLSHENRRHMMRETMNLYNQAEILIVPSLSMRQFLLENRIRQGMKFVIQEMWDYTISDDFYCSSAFQKDIALIHEGKSEALNSGQVQNELIKGGFGVVWYKSTYEYQYMEYGASFLLGKFLALGIPVIVPVRISNQTLLERNHLGLIGNSLDEAVTRANAMSEAERQEYIRCAEQFAPVLRSGYYTKRCFLETLQEFYREDVGRFSGSQKTYRASDFVFLSAVLKESYEERLALSWSFKGTADGFLIYDESGVLMFGTDNIRQHYYQIDGYGKENGFIVKAYVETLKGKLVIAESEVTHLDERVYEEPKVSMIIPAYNAEKYVVRSIDTALAQSFADLEVIIIDDGSTDRTPEILDWYKEKYPNVRVIHQENGGVAAARNTGIIMAKGEYIGFIDNDDMVHPDMVARLYDSAKRNDCDIAVTSVYKVKNDGYEAFIQYPMEEDSAVIIEDFFDMHFTKGCMFAVVIWNKLYRASVIKSRLLPVMIADDNAWTPYILSYADKICYLDDCAYEWDRKIRSSTQVDQWQRRPKSEIFHTHKDTIMFYLKKGNPRRLGMLKRLAKRQLFELKTVYEDEEYGELWKQIERMF